MMTLHDLLNNNREWSRSLVEQDAEFFTRLSKQQTPEYLWVGCADSRVPANEIVGMQPGELFVHRNVANLVYGTDPNALSVIQYAVEALKVKHIIVCGHYGCGGVKASTEGKELGLIDSWLSGIKQVYQNHAEELEQLQGDARIDRLCELNVCQQVENVSQLPVVQRAWRNGHELTVHGWIYGLSDGLLNDLGVSINSAEQVEQVYRLVE
ncbi:carbonate dehydratase [Porticoccus sp. W117]|uniref:carbonate dehydratase n=1 Tax=Porticoccus sp. W117 TaxID=3054777 RepID=UPI002598D700|nr:carbonate dehydratase [Porticoccus sp. W117]MDM3872418.1 carbonate dehydratase [Porticoccus sp. W117]